MAERVARSALEEGHELSRVVDMIIGSLLASLRVPAAGAAWTLYLGATEVGAQGQTKESVLLESLRLYPPTWLIRRTTTRATELGGYALPPGHNVALSPYVLNRDSTAFASAAVFDPSRWDDGGASVRRGFTFGGGIHLCPGRDAGAAMILSALRTLRTGWDVIGDRASKVVADPRTTLFPAGLQVSLETRPTRAL